MHMTGFAFAPTDCVILLFQTWKLDSAAKFAAAVLGTVALGIVCEALTWFRRTRMSAAAAARAPRRGAVAAGVRWLRAAPRRWRAAMALLFTVQATLGYFLMLVAMTYQGELFIAVVAGLGLGHFTFNVSAPVSESADACCVDDVQPPEAEDEAAAKVHPALRTVAADGGGGGDDDDAPALRTASATTTAAVATAHVEVTKESVCEGGAPPPRGGGAVALTLRVRPMTCSGCQRNVLTALTAVDGVSGVQVRRTSPAASHRWLSPVSTRVSSDRSISPPSSSRCRATRRSPSTR